MAKDKSELQAARDDLGQAQQAYDKLVRQNTSKMDEEERQKHYQKCREVLKAKREAKKIVREREKGVSKPPPDTAKPKTKDE